MTPQVADFGLSKAVDESLIAIQSIRLDNIEGANTEEGKQKQKKKKRKKKKPFEQRGYQVNELLSSVIPHLHLTIPHAMVF